MMPDVREEFSMTRDVRESAKSDQATGGQSQLDPILDALKWMRECQHSYTEEQLNFWVLLQPLTNGGEVSSRHLACRLLSVWPWASMLNPLTGKPFLSQFSRICIKIVKCNIYLNFIL